MVTSGRGAGRVGTEEDAPDVGLCGLPTLALVR
jgi:hypothetical protein